MQPEPDTLIDMGAEPNSLAGNKIACMTIASTEPKGVGERCDKDELTAMKTNHPFVEKEKENGKEVYDLTIPLHDPKGRIIATAGITFKPYLISGKRTSLCNLRKSFANSRLESNLDCNPHGKRATRDR